MYLKDAFTYSNQDRLLTHTHQIGLTGAPELLADNTYNELGQLVSKKVGRTVASPLQKVDYSYNIRGWMTEINKVAGSTNPLQQGTDPLDLFAFKINYNTVQNETNYTGKELYNGNISETYWRTSSDNVLRKYGYFYDDLNRLLNSYYQKPDISSTPLNSYNESMNYDKNGNIVSLIRNGELDSAVDILEIDRLNYLYDTDSNRLLTVHDDTVDPNGFKDDTNSDPFDQTDDYHYDANGNMNYDENKGITNIVYNHLNLPTQITFDIGIITYLYDATGKKLRKRVHTNNNTPDVITDYLDGFQYKDQTIQFFPTAEGYVNRLNTQYDAGEFSVIDKNATDRFSYVYNYTDHLGNIRLSYTQDPTTHVLKIIEENHYYPFGLKHNNYNSDKMVYAKENQNVKLKPLPPTMAMSYNYKYNGKELQDELGLNWYDYQARNYDPAIGRWMNIDPLAEMSRRFSPYTYALNNPVYFIDPDGKLATPPDWYLDSRTGAVLGKDGANTDNYRVINKSDWDDKVQSLGGSTSPEATSQLQQASSIISINETKINSDMNAINNSTIANQTMENQVYIGLNVDRSGDVPTAELTSTIGPAGRDGQATVSIDDRVNPEGIVTSSKFRDTNLIPLAQSHTHNLTRNTNMVNAPGPSVDDGNTARNFNISIYPIDSYTGNSAGGNAIHKVAPNGTITNNIGTTTTNNSIGNDALKQRVNP